MDRYEFERDRAVTMAEQTLRMTANLLNQMGIGRDSVFTFLPYTDYDPQDPDEDNYKSGRALLIDLPISVNGQKEYYTFQMIVMDEMAGKYKFRHEFRVVDETVDTRQFNARHSMPVKRSTSCGRSRKYIYGFGFERSGIFGDIDESIKGFSILMSYLQENATEFQKMGFRM